MHCVSGYHDETELSQAELSYVLSKTEYSKSMLQIIDLHITNTALSPVEHFRSEV